MSRDLAILRESLENNTEDFEELSEEQQSFLKSVNKVLPIHFEEFKHIEGNQTEADLMIKAHEYYFSKIKMLIETKEYLKKEKFSQKNLFSYAGKSVKTILNQKDKYSTLLNYIDLLQEDYENQVKNILGTYIIRDTKNIKSDNQKYGNEELTARLIETEDKYNFYVSKIDELKDIVSNNKSNDEKIKKIKMILDCLGYNDEN